MHSHQLTSSLINCSYDLREPSGPVHWHDAKLLGDRAMFHADGDVPYLLISNLNVEDAGVYKCRVDFEKAPTTNRRSNLTIIGKKSALAGSVGRDTIVTVLSVRIGRKYHSCCYSCWYWTKIEDTIVTDLSVSIGRRYHSYCYSC